MRGWAFLAACLLGIAVTSGAWAQPSIEDFASLPLFRAPAVSPDGRYVAAIQAVDGRPIVTVYEGAKPPVVVSSPDAVVVGLRWVKPDRVAVFLTTDQRLPFDYGNTLLTWGRTIVMSPNGEAQKVLLKDKDYAEFNVGIVSIADIALDDPDSIYMPYFNYSASSGERRRDILKVNVRSGGGQILMRGNFNTRSWVMDGSGHVVARVDFDENSMEEAIFTRDGEEWKPLATYPARGKGGAGVVGLTTDGTALVRYGSSGGSYGLARMDLKTGRESALFNDPRYDVEEVVTDDWTDRVIGVRYVAEMAETHYFEPEWQRLQNGLKKAFPGLSVFAVSVSRDRKTAIVRTEGPRAPPKFYYLTRDTGEASLLAETYPNIAESDLGTMKTYDYKARDGLNIPAYITLPPGSDGKGLPLVVMPHGGPESRDQLGFDWWAQFLASRGYAVLQPNFRGSGGYGHAFEYAGHREWGGKMQDDVTDGVRKAIADGIADPKRVCIVGASYGGYAALAGAAFTPDLYACAVSVSGISDLEDMHHYFVKLYGSPSKALAVWEQRIGDPDKDEAMIEARSPVNKAAAVKCPVLLIHPLADTTVPVKQSRMMADALEDAGKDVTLVEIEGDDHYLQLAATRIAMLTKLESFLAAHIGK